jgi:hypothetical protein
MGPRIRMWTYLLGDIWFSIRCEEALSRQSRESPFKDSPGTPGQAFILSLLHSCLEAMSQWFTHLQRRGGLGWVGSPRSAFNLLCDHVLIRLLLRLPHLPQMRLQECVGSRGPAHQRLDDEGQLHFILGNIIEMEPLVSQLNEDREPSLVCRTWWVLALSRSFSLRTEGSIQCVTNFIRDGWLSASLAKCPPIATGRQPEGNEVTDGLTVWAFGQLTQLFQISTY